MRSFAEHLAPGTVLGGRWRLVAPAADVGGAILYDAESVDGARVRVLVAEALDLDLAWFSHPAVPRVLAVGKDRLRSWVVQEHFAGVPLFPALVDRLTRELDPLPRALQLARPLTELLRALHSAGSVHGALGPSSVWIAADGSVRVVDLGVRGGSERAPEVLSGRPADRRSDVYGVASIVKAVAGADLPLVASLALDAASTSSPDRRSPDVGVLLDALRACVNESAPAAAPPVVRPTRRSTAELETAPLPVPPPRPAPAPESTIPTGPVPTLTLAVVRSTSPTREPEGEDALGPLVVLGAVVTTAAASGLAAVAATLILAIGWLSLPSASYAATDPEPAVEIGPVSVEVPGTAPAPAPHPKAKRR